MLWLLDSRLGVPLSAAAAVRFVLAAGSGRRGRVPSVLQLHVFDALLDGDGEARETEVVISHLSYAGLISLGFW